MQMRGNPVYQNRVRRQWLRAIHIVADLARSPDTLELVGTEVLQLLQFFRWSPGLRRQIGAILALYYSPSSAVGL